MDKDESRTHHNVLIYVVLPEDEFPPASNTPEDLALLRAADLAMRRKAMGIRDTFLILVVGTGISDAASAAMLAYGFPDAKITLVDAANPDDELAANNDCLEGVDKAARNWLTVNHPEAVGFAAGPYCKDTFWWIGVASSERARERFTWPFSVDAFAAELPRAHMGKAATWLSILASATKRIAMHDEVSEQRASAAAATLCEWLHGFEAASGNGYNSFDSTSTIAAFEISPFFWRSRRRAFPASHSNSCVRSTTLPFMALKPSLWDSSLAACEMSCVKRSRTFSAVTHGCSGRCIRRFGQHSDNPCVSRLTLW